MTIVEILSLIIIIMLILYCGLTVYLINKHAKERQQLLNRIMAKDYQEYINYKRDDKPTASRNFITKYRDDYKNNKNNKNNKLKFYSEAGDE